MFAVLAKFLAVWSVAAPDAAVVCVVPSAKVICPPAPLVNVKLVVRIVLFDE